MIIEACVGLSVIKFRSQEKNMEKYDREIFKIPFYPWSVYLCIGLPFMLIIFLKPITIFIAILWLLMGFVIYQFQIKKQKMK
jgi:L-asparagine transporter-like permease